MLLAEFPETVLVGTRDGRAGFMLKTALAEIAAMGCLEAVLDGEAEPITFAPGIVALSFPMLKDITPESLVDNTVLSWPELPPITDNITVEPQTLTDGVMTIEVGFTSAVPAWIVTDQYHASTLGVVR